MHAYNLALKSDIKVINCVKMRLILLCSKFYFQLKKFSLQKDGGLEKKFSQ